MLIYIFTNTFRKSGGSVSCDYLSKSVSALNGYVLCLTYTSFLSSLRRNIHLLFFLFKQKELSHSIQLFIPAPNLVSLGIVSNTFNYFKTLYFLLCFFIFFILLKKKFHVSPSILLSELPDPTLYHLFKFYFPDCSLHTLLRSSPHCLSWSSSFRLRNSILQSLKLSDSLVSASRDVFDMWNDLVKFPLNFTFLTVPISARKIIKFNSIQTKTFNFLLAAGSLGPRKGILLLFDALISLHPDVTINVHLLGQQPFGIYDRFIQKLNNINHISVFAHGFVDHITIHADPERTAFLFPSYSENQSRAQLEACKYSLPIFANTKSVSDEVFIKYQDRVNLFCSSRSLQILMREFISNPSSFSARVDSSNDFTGNLSLFDSQLKSILL